MGKKYGARPPSDQGERRFDEKLTKATTTSDDSSKDAHPTIRTEENLLTTQHRRKMADKRQPSNKQLLNGFLFDQLVNQEIFYSTDQLHMVADSTLVGGGTPYLLLNLYNSDTDCSLSK